MAAGNSVSTFIPLADVEGAFFATNGALRCTAFRLQDGGLCLYNPVSGLGADAKQSLHALGTVTHIFAPNHYHHRGVTDYAEAYPEARLCASPAAIPRLIAQTGRVFEGLDELKHRFPISLSLLEPDGLKTGEIWVRSKTAALTAWFVVDAFAGAKMTGGQSMFSEPGFLGTFPNFGVRDKKLYCGWVAAQLAEDNPQLLVPCHGGITASSNLPKLLAKIQHDKFGS